MWIFLKKKLPTEVSPPKLSIHWSGASAEDLGTLKKQKENRAQILEDAGEFFTDLFGKVHKEEGARWILFGETPIKVFPDEYSALSEQSMAAYLGHPHIGDGRSITHLPREGKDYLLEDLGDDIGPVVEARITLEELGTYFAARLDTNHVLATYIALGVDLDNYLGTLPTRLWFSMRELLANTFCYADEQREDWPKETAFQRNWRE